MSNYEFDATYSALTGEHVGGIYVPTVEANDDAVHGVLIDGVPRTSALEYPDMWYALTGYTRQHGYRGAVMHPSETASDEQIREWVRDAGGDVFAIVTVADPRDELDENGALHSDPDNGYWVDPEPVGWAVIYLPAA